MQQAVAEGQGGEAVGEAAKRAVDSVGGGSVVVCLHALETACQAVAGRAMADGRPAEHAAREALKAADAAGADLDPAIRQSSWHAALACATMAMAHGEAPAVVGRVTRMAALVDRPATQQPRDAAALAADVSGEVVAYAEARLGTAPRQLLRDTQEAMQTAGAPAPHAAEAAARLTVQAALVEALADGVRPEAVDEAVRDVLAPPSAAEPSAALGVVAATAVAAGHGPELVMEETLRAAAEAAGPGGLTEDARYLAARQAALASARGAAVAQGALAVGQTARRASMASSLSDDDAAQLAKDVAAEAMVSRAPKAETQRAAQAAGATETEAAALVGRHTLRAAVTEALGAGATAETVDAAIARTRRGSEAPMSLELADALAGVCETVATKAEAGGWHPHSPLSPLVPKAHSLVLSSIAEGRMTLHPPVPPAAVRRVPRSAPSSDAGSAAPSTSFVTALEPLDEEPPNSGPDSGAQTSGSTRSGTSSPESGASMRAANTTAAPPPAADAEPQPPHTPPKDEAARAPDPVPRPPRSSDTNVTPAKPPRSASAPGSPRPDSGTGNSRALGSPDGGAGRRLHTPGSDAKLRSPPGDASRRPPRSPSASAQMMVVATRTTPEIARAGVVTPRPKPEALDAVDDGRESPKTDSPTSKKRTASRGSLRGRGRSHSASPKVPSSQGSSLSSSPTGSRGDDPKDGAVEPDRALKTPSLPAILPGNPGAMPQPSCPSWGVPDHRQKRRPSFPPKTEPGLGPAGALEQDRSRHYHLTSPPLPSPPLERPAHAQCEFLGGRSPRSQHT